MREAIRDSRNFIIGYIDQIAPSQWAALNMNGCRVGVYDANTDRTYDTRGFQVAYGNQLMGMLYQGV